MQEMLLEVVRQIPAGKDYVIVDRCAGVGNLEEGLPDDVLSHCILSTIEPNEYQILLWKFAAKSAVVIPETDALAFDIIPSECDIFGNVVNDYVREKVNDPNCVVILVENPPFSEAGSGGTQKTGKKNNKWKQSVIARHMKNNGAGRWTNELSNLFIWSAFRYYLTKPEDHYILFAPTKYWRNQNLVNKRFVGGFLCNRKEFHASLNSAMSCICWKNEDDLETKAVTLTPYNIKANYVERASEDIRLQKTDALLSEQYDRRPFESSEPNGILCEADGSEFRFDGRQVRCKPIYDKTIIAYLKTDSFAIDRKHVSLTRCGYFKGDGFFMREDNFLEKLPLFVASVFPCKVWYKTDVYSKCYDGNGAHLEDKDFLKKCLIYTVLTLKNKCRSLTGSDGRYYRNELCLDGNTLAKRALDRVTPTKREQTLLKYFNDVLFEAKGTEEYDKFKSYGPWQISEELNIRIPSGRQDKHGKDILVRKYPKLNTEIDKLKKELEHYYEEAIIPDLFKYRLIK